MERRAFSTPAGEVWFWGDEPAFSGSGPVVLFIHGAFAPFRRLQKIGPHVKGAAAAYAHLPANHCPAFANPTLEAVAEAYTEAAAAAFGDRNLIVFGESAGGLVALQMEREGLRRFVIEPPICPHKMWPYVEQFREWSAQSPPMQAFLGTMLGIWPDRLEPKDYRHLLDRRARVILGGEPLYPERECKATPSVVDDAERAAMLANPAMRVTVVDGAGHMVLHAVTRYVIDAISEVVLK